MTWQVVIIIQILASTAMTMFARSLTLSTKKVFFGMGLLSYTAVAICGLLFSVLYNQGAPTGLTLNSLPYIVAQGIFIPAAWLIQYKLIGYIGAGNTMTISVLNTICTALLGIAFLQESLSLSFIVGALMVVGSTFISLRIKPDSNHRVQTTKVRLIFLIFSGALLFATGMFFEKIAIDQIGVWNYSAYGWGMQMVGAVMIFLIFGKAERNHITSAVVRNGLLLGVLTSIAGGLYIFALSIGTLSHTIIATSGKVAITVLLAAVFLNERNTVSLRVLAFALSMAGLWLVVH